MKMTNSSLQEVKTRDFGGIEGDSKALSGVTRLYAAASRLDRVPPRAATGCNCREFPTHFYGVHHAFISCHYAGGMGACSGGYDTRFSVLVRCREAHRKGLHHARGSGYDDGRLCTTIPPPQFKV